MKTKATLSLALMTLLALAYPAASLAALLTGWTIELYSVTAVLAVMIAANAVLAWLAVSAPKEKSWPKTLLTMVLPALSALTAFQLTTAAFSALNAILAAINLAIAVFTAIFHRRNFLTDLVTLLLAALPVFLAALAIAAAVSDPAAMESPTGFRTVLELPSPEGGYMAELSYNSDFSLTDSNAIVNIHYPGVTPIEFGVGRLTPRPRIATFLSWEDFELADLKWIDETTLAVGEKIYDVSGKIPLITTASNAE